MQRQVGSGSEVRLGRAVWGQGCLGAGLSGGGLLTVELCQPVAARGFVCLAGNVLGWVCIILALPVEGATSPTRVQPHPRQPGGSSRPVYVPAYQLRRRRPAYTAAAGITRHDTPSPVRVGIVCI